MVGIKSDVGNIRKLNEDYAEYLETDKYKLYIIADGMGGHNAGEVASMMAVKEVKKYFENNFQINDIGFLKKAILAANKAVYEYSHKEVEYNGMGTTLTACLIVNDKVQIGHVGDSCCFGIKNNNVTKITKDHSLVQELLDMGSINEEQAEKHPQRNVITRAIGTSEWVEVDIYNVLEEDYNVFMLCSDGLTNEVKKEDVIKVLENNVNFNDACSSLIEIAKSRGGRDNITVMLFGGEV